MARLSLVNLYMFNMIVGTHSSAIVLRSGIVYLIAVVGIKPFHLQFWVIYYKNLLLIKADRILVYTQFYWQGELFSNKATGSSNKQ